MNRFFSELKNFPKKCDWVLLLLCFVTSAFGCVVIASTTSADKFGSNFRYIAIQVGATVIVKGLRAGSDFENEFQMALINRKLNPDLDTIFLTAEHQFTYLSSSTVKELGSYGVDLSDFLPEPIIPDFKKRMCELRQGGNTK